ncbi:MAG: cytochrome c peroxidase [Prosthecobacter sp.]|nr:cytochrome c peroxidase [Prosthecobacter sp.]
MKASHLLIALVFATNMTATLRAQSGVLDLTTLHDYANQTVPAYITRNNTPGNNAITNAGATLGRVLFYDKRLSRDDTISCASCHQQAHGFGDTATASTGVAGTTGRHGMRLINARFAQEVRFFWDERATSLENQTTQPIQNHVEMGFSGTLGDPAFADLVTKLSAIPEYRVLFAQTFGSAAITETLVQRAIAQFVRSIQSFDSRYDAGRTLAGADGPPFANFTPSENGGKQLFLAPPPGGAGCAGCHRPPEFDIDPNSRNNGVITSIGGGTDLTNTRSPSLRDLAGPDGLPNGGMMHDGSFTTLAQVMNHYNLIPGDNTNLDPRLRRPGGAVQNLNLTVQQRNDLAAFMLTLTGSAVYSDEKWSNPFNAQGELALIILPPAATTVQNNGNGTATITCAAAPGLTYQVESSNDLKIWTDAGSITADVNGMLVHSVAIAPSTFYRFTYTP